MFRLTQHFDIGEIVLYDHQSDALLALILTPRKEKALLLNERGREIQLQTNRLLKLPQNGRRPAGETLQQKTHLLIELRTEAEALVKSIILEDVWQFVQETPKEYSSSELTTLYFGEDSLVQHVAMRLALNERRTYFKRTKDGFSPRSPEAVEEMRHAETVQQCKEQEREELRDFFSQRLAGTAVPCPERLKPLIEGFLDVAAGCQDVEPALLHEVREALTLLRHSVPPEQIKLPGGSVDEADHAFHYLLAAGFVKPDENLYFRRHRMPSALDAKAESELQATIYTVTSHLEQVVSLHDAAIHTLTDGKLHYGSQRVDLTHLSCFTIDDETTTDADDATSLSYLEDGYQLGIHITDLASFVVPYSIADSELCERATSIYNPDETRHMITYDPFREACSLLSGSQRFAISLLVLLERDFSVRSYTFVPSIIKIEQRYSYDEVDSLLNQGDRFFETYYQAASTFEAARISQGALRVEKREAIVVPTTDGGLKVIELDDNTPARMIIRELMVLYNHAVALLAERRKVPLPFRCQEAPDQNPSGNINEVPHGPAFDYAARGQLKRSYISTSPAIHSSLGLSAYTQVTSPLRRYLDLVCQRQLANILGISNFLYNEEQLQSLIEKTSPGLARAHAITKDTKRYWFLRYLEEKAHHKVSIDGTIIKLDKRYQLVLLEEIFMVAQTKSLGDLSLGASVRLTINAVSARGDILRLSALT
jgi:exoribonuclease II